MPSQSRYHGGTRRVERRMRSRTDRTHDALVARVLLLADGFVYRNRRATNMFAALHQQVETAVPEAGRPAYVRHAGRPISPHPGDGSASLAGRERNRRTVRPLEHADPREKLGVPHEVARVWEKDRIQPHRKGAMWRQGSDFESKAADILGLYCIFRIMRPSLCRRKPPFKRWIGMIRFAAIARPCQAAWL
jgi:hypothetical protein